VQLAVEVGNRLDPNVSDPESPALTMVAGEPVRLTIALSHPHELEVQAVTAAPTRFAWVDGDHVAVLAYRLGPILPWAEAVYHPQLCTLAGGVPGVDRDPVVEIALVDLGSGEVRALHRVRWPGEFAATVRDSVARMRERPHDRIAYEHTLAGLRRRFPTPDDLVVDRAEALCTATPVAGKA
jgi:hypothetical protein